MFALWGGTSAPVSISKRSPVPNAFVPHGRAPASGLAYRYSFHRRCRLDYRGCACRSGIAENRKFMRSREEGRGCVMYVVVLAYHS